MTTHADCRTRKQMYRGALHIVQVREFPKPEGLQQQGEPGNVFLLEYLRRGSFYRMIRTVEQYRQVLGRFPDRVLWLIFQCCKSSRSRPGGLFESTRHAKIRSAERFRAVVQCCIALEYPPMRDNQFKRMADPVTGKIDGEFIKERVPDDHDGGSGTNLVHFDIDPRNSKSQFPVYSSRQQLNDFLACETVIIGDSPCGPKSDPHGLVPVMKLGDFGLANVFTPGHYKDA